MCESTDFAPVEDLETGATVEPKRPAVSAALAKAQAAAKAVFKASENDHHGYVYASAEDVILESKAALASAELAFTRTGFSLEKAAFGLAMFACYELRHSSGETLCFESVTPVIPGKGRPLDKAVLTARTADLAYTLRDLLLLPRVDYDVDGRDDRGYDPAPHAPVNRQAETAPPAPTEPPAEGGDQLADEFIAEIERLYQAGDLEGLMQIPHRVSALNFPPAERNRIVQYFNPRKIELVTADGGAS